MPILQRLFSECLQQNRILASWSKARIVIIPKEAKDSALPQDSRPIALLNLDYKMLTMIFARRLNRILGSYIHRDQAGSVKKIDICGIKLGYLLSSLIG